MRDQPSSIVDHWNKFYSSSSTPVLPSQFAVFALNEAPLTQSVVEFGCGNGRDSFFFARQGLKVLGGDRSDAGVNLCRATSEREGINARFELCNLNDADSVNSFLDMAKSELTGQLLIYARFFVHAIDEGAELVLLQAAASLLSQHSGALMVEFRTQRDKEQTKVTPDHYRRYVDPLVFAQRGASIGLQCGYFVEGFGMAKYKADDAHVARLILTHE